MFFAGRGRPGPRRRDRIVPPSPQRPGNGRVAVPGRTGPIRECDRRARATPRRASTFPPLAHVSRATRDSVAVPGPGFGWYPGVLLGRVYLSGCTGKVSPGQCLCRFESGRGQRPPQGPWRSGSALPWHGRGRGFDSLRLHQGCGRRSCTPASSQIGFGASPSLLSGLTP